MGTEEIIDNVTFMVIRGAEPQLQGHISLSGKNLIALAALGKGLGALGQAASAITEDLIKQVNEEMARA